MRHCFGLNEYLFRQKKQEVLVHMDTSELINGHLLLTGMSGTGKSWQLQNLIESGAKQGIEFDIFDVHDELDVGGAMAVLYSNATRYGYNPLVLNTDPHSGGVRQNISGFVALINTTSSRLGPKQEAALRNLLYDIYFMVGCRDDDPRSWHKKEITERDRAALIEASRYDELRQYYPTLDDLIGYAERKIRAMYLGGDTKTVRLLESVNRATHALNRMHRKSLKVEHGGSDEEKEKLKSKLEDMKARAIQAYTDYVTNIETGRELSDVLKYSSLEVLQTTLERIQILNTSGTMRSNPPPFGNARVRCHQIRSLSEDEQKLFVYRRIAEIFTQRKDGGVKPDVCHVILLDEAHKFFVEDGDHIINVVAKEARKFGIGLWCASQSPTHFPEDFLSNCGTTILLGIHTMYWDMACRKLRIEPNVLKWIRPQRVAAIKLQRKGDMAPCFQNVILAPTTA
jgi:DNA helicase HerA-like ATPase